MGIKNGQKWVETMYQALVAEHGSPYEANDFMVFGMIFDEIKALPLGSDQERIFSDDAIEKYEELSCA